MLPGKWKLTEVTIVGGAEHPIEFSEDVTFEVHEPPFPKSATVSWVKSLRLADGESFDFELRLETPPVDYDKGVMQSRFELIKPDPPEGNPVLEQHRPAVSNPYIEPQHLDAVEVRTELKNGETDYKLSLPIIQSAWPSVVLSLGRWRLAAVTLGQRVRNPVSVKDDVTFDVQVPNIHIHTQAPAGVKAGERFDFKVSADGIPKNAYCMTTLSAQLRERSSEGQPNPNGSHVEVAEVPLDPQQHMYEMSGFFASDIPSGPWEGKLGVAARPKTGREWVGGRISPGLCPQPDLVGDTRFFFNVKADKDLRTPTSVAVIINPSQVQLLRAEADRLKAKVGNLRTRSGSQNAAAEQDLLLEDLKWAVDDLQKTEARYKEEETAAGPSSERAVNAFFDDIRINYDEARKALGNVSGQLRRAGPQMERVSAGLGGAPPLKAPGADAVLRSYLYHVKACELAASAGAMTRDLDVLSDPKGATVSYWQRGDPEPKILEQETDTKISNIYRAHYFIRFQKSGYRDETKGFEGNTSTSTYIRVQLVRDGSAR